MILLNPGPVNLTERVRNAMLGPDLCHREEEYQALQDSIRRDLLSVYGLASDRWAAVLLTGSGTSALEMMIASVIPADGKLLVVSNGIYGERISKIAAIHGIQHRDLSYPWGERVDSGAVEEMLATDASISHLAVIHHETTTGRLNDLRELGALCQSRGVVLLADCVSSFGAERIDFDDCGIAACAATGGKCLHGVPGASFVVVNRELLSKGAQRTLYLDLNTACAAQDQRTTAFTPAVQSYYALSAALTEFAEHGGWKARHERYRRLCEQVNDGLQNLGIRPLLTGPQSVVLRSYRLPDGMTYELMHDRLKQHGFVIYAGQGALFPEIFRISTMGTVDDADVSRLLSVIADAIQT